MISRVYPSALSDLRPGLRLADPARPIVSVHERGVACASAPPATSRCARSVLGRCRISTARTVVGPVHPGPGLGPAEYLDCMAQEGDLASLDAEDRPSRMSHPASRRRIRYSRRIGTADHHARGPDGSRIRSSQPLADF
jgi:hypothetical protein